MQLLFNLMTLFNLIIFVKQHRRQKEPLTEFIVKKKQIVALNKGIPEASC